MAFSDRDLKEDKSVSKDASNIMEKPEENELIIQQDNLSNLVIFF